MSIKIKKRLVYLILGDPLSPLNAVADDLANHLRLQSDETIAVIKDADHSYLDKATSSISFLLINGSTNPVDWLEDMQKALFKNSFKLGRIIFLADMIRLSKNPQLKDWARACVHFSDVVLMNRIEGVTQNWLQEFKEPFEKDCYPCLFISLKEEQMYNPALVLEPLPLRISQVFDEEYQKQPKFLKEINISPNEWAKDFADNDEYFDEAFVDPYFERLPNGIRVKKIHSLP